LDIQNNCRTILDIQNTVSDIRNSYLDIQNNYFGYLKKRLNDNSACHTGHTDMSQALLQCGH